jgi:ClpP class serine protease
MINEKFGCHIIRSDCERNALKKIFPELDIGASTARDNEQFQKYLKELVKEYKYAGRDKIKIVLEGTDISVEKCKELYLDEEGKENNIIYFLGTANTTADELMKSIKKNDDDYDWTAELEEKLMELCEDIVSKSKTYKKECEKYKIKFEETSGENRKDILQNIIEKISKILDEARE